MYVSRTIESFIRRASEKFPVIAVTGPRQVGKTTTLRRLAEPERRYVTLDDPLVLELARRDPPLFLQRYRPPLLIDEIQHAPDLLPYIKMSVDEHRHPGMFWLTGSQQFHLMKGMSESLAGRVAILRMQGLSRRELLGLGHECRPMVPRLVQDTRSEEDELPLGVQHLYELIWRGSLPPMALDSGMLRDTFFGSYVQTYLQRDLRDFARIGDLSAFLRFLRACAARTAQILNIADLARDSDIAPATARSWLAILEATGIIHLLQPYHTNVVKRLIKAPKLHFLDTGLCAYLTAWTSPEALEAGAMSGAILESWVVSEFLKSWWHTGVEAPVWYVRDRDGHEVDILVVEDGVAYPFEIKKTASPKPSDLAAFERVGDLGLRVGPGGIICLVNQQLPLAPTFDAIPTGLI